jgi:hypothetical protein
MEAAKGTLQRAMTGYIEWLIRRSRRPGDALERRFYDLREVMGESLPGGTACVVEAAAHLLMATRCAQFWLDTGSSSG